MAFVFSKSSAFSCHRSFGNDSSHSAIIDGGSCALTRDEITVAFEERELEEWVGASRMDSMRSKHLNFAVESGEQPV